ncbi:MAG: pilus assembly protein PilC [bacterium (Candidatus Ratteibacteria) CG01_land_8_20_14_3_00_40_19]|uniref:Pilus assembly protein PilC n=2 Tax=Candidatus Ratteibacteria TaxID=2979319 RepID=A0A2M7E9B5_9BACT|nr:MAG: pilus assembly protein PilC [bacterium (Candidatus Ratteibacteria) CG01_land_8_20_14_3_00_40_19]PIW32145.1 MAG: pilus assembly protein PilC [bacterium (Candidatus Ratteibacteria) CG15_BIG_FIL_POST_REV_8_21_14_020_41_12]
MALYRYTARTLEGELINSTMEATEEAEVVKSLRERKLTIVSIAAETKRKRKKTGASWTTAKISLDDLVVFSRQLATMVDAGLPMIQILDILAKQVENKGFRVIIGKIRDEVSTGNNLSEALEKHPKVFSSLYVNMVRAGEASGALDDILDRLANYLEATNTLRKKIKSAMMYPIAIILVAIVITSFLLLKVIPTFKGIFEGLGGKLPGPTALLLMISDLFRHWFLVILGGVFLAFLAFRFYIHTEKGKFQFDSVSLKLPVFGKLIRKIVVSRFARTLSTLVKSGISILNALEIVGKTSGNKVVERTISDARKNIREGEPISEPLNKSGVFPPMITQMIAVGEETGSLEEMLSKAADFYDAEVDAAVSGLTSLIEPVIMVVLGVVIGGIAVAMLLPIFKISQLVH